MEFIIDCIIVGFFLGIGFEFARALDLPKWIKLGISKLINIIFS